MAMFDDIPLNARSLSYRWDGYDYRLQLDPEHLTVEWKSPAYSRVSKTALRDLKPELAVEQWVSEDGLRRGLGAVGRLASTGIAIGTRDALRLGLGSALDARGFSPSMTRHLLSEEDKTGTTQPLTARLPSGSIGQQ